MEEGTPTEYQMLRVEEVRATIVYPSEARKLGIEPYVCIPLTKATKTSRRAPPGALITWSTADGTKVGGGQAAGRRRHSVPRPVHPPHRQQRGAGAVE